MTKEKSTESHEHRFPLKGYLFLVGTAFFTALSYAFGRAVDRRFDPESTVFYWFFGAFVCAALVSLAIPSQRVQARNLRRYTKIFIYSSFLTAVGAAL